MAKPYVIAINAVSGGGKTSLAKMVHESLPRSVVFCFDDFDESNVYPENYYEWWERGADLQEFDCPGLKSAVEAAIRQGTAEFIVLDYPFGRDHPVLRDVIDLSIYIDTPLDVAMARRIIRDCSAASAASGEGAARILDQLRSELSYYLEKARLVYLDTERHRPGSDLILDGSRSLPELRIQVLERLSFGDRPQFKI